MRNKKTSKCSLCGRFVANFTVKSCPATGKTIITTPPHYCELLRDTKGRFTDRTGNWRRALKEQLDTIEHVQRIRDEKERMEGL